VQAKGGNDRLGMVQTQQDIACCAEKFPGLICRAISTQFLADDRITIFELTVENEELRVMEERHYELVPAGRISAAGLERYASS
jgi:hypothetical protein